MKPLENISEFINDYYKYMTQKAYPYDSIQLYGTRTSASDEAVVILKGNALRYMLSLLNVKLVI